MTMILKAILSNKTHPEYGQATVPFPIPDSEYDHTIGLLEDMGIGSSTGQDCRVDGLDLGCPGEAAQFQAMASKLCLSDIKDFINLTFCCQQATVITDFSDLERVGKEHSLNINGGAMPMEEYDRLEGRNVALDLILNRAGTITPYGVVYDNGMRLEQVYDHIPHRGI